MGIRTLVVAVLAWAPSISHADSELPNDLTIKAAAPLALSEADLGRPVSVRFEPIIGKDGKPLFGTKPRRTTVNAFWHDFQSIDSTHELQANARGWMVDVSISNAAQSRYVVYRAIQVTSAIEVDDTDEPRAAGSDAAYYIRKIYFGRVYEQVFSGSADEFTTGVRAELLAIDGAVRFQQAHRNIASQVFARGLSPKATAIFAKTPKEIQDAYTEDKTYNAGNPVPVLVEYRRIPGAKLDDYNEFEWKKPPPVVGQVKVRLIQVDGRKNDWTDTGLSLGPNDLLVGQAEGKVKIGEWSGQTEPTATGIGRLDVNIDGNVGPTGKSFVTTKVRGTVRLRIYDTDYSDNSGAYSVLLLVVPQAALLASDCAKIDRNGTASCR